jgi:hypothetical protein
VTETNGHLVEVQKVDEAVVALNRMRRVEMVLVTVGALGMVATGVFAGWAAWETHNTSATIKSCTTPEGKCYQDTTVRARANTRNQQEELNRQHRVIQCVLLIAPVDRDIGDLATCEAEHPPKKNGNGGNP